MACVFAIVFILCLLQVGFSGLNRNELLSGSFSSINMDTDLSVPLKHQLGIVFETNSELHDYYDILGVM